MNIIYERRRDEEADISRVSEILVGEREGEREEGRLTCRRNTAGQIWSGTAKRKQTIVSE